MGRRYEKMADAAAASNADADQDRFLRTATPSAKPPSELRGKSSESIGGPEQSGVQLIDKERHISLSRGCLDAFTGVVIAKFDSPLTALCSSRAQLAAWLL